MPKILSVDYTSINSLSGIATFNRNLKKIFGDNIDFLTFYRGKKVYSDCEKNIGMPELFIFKIINYLLSYRISAFAINYYIEKNYSDYEVIIVNSPSLVRYLDGNKRKIILVQHQDFDVMMSNRSNFSSNEFLHQVMDKISYFVSLSPFDQKYIVEKIPDKFSHKVKFIRHMLPSQPESQDEKSRTKSKFSRSLVSIGRLDLKQKRLDLAIRAMSQLPDWTLTIYGDGPDKEEIEKIVYESSLKNINLAGHTSDAFNCLLNHDIHIMVSDFEGYGLTNIEAMSCGLPLIVRNTFLSAKDVVEGNGILLNKVWDVSEYISALSIIEENYRDYSLNSKKLANRHSYNVISQKWKNLINMCCR